MTHTNVDAILLALFFLTAISMPFALAQENQLVEILPPVFASGPFRTGETVEVHVRVRNLSNQSRLVLVGLTVRDPNGVPWDVPARPMFLDPNQEAQIMFLWNVPPNAPPGQYDLILCVWEGMSGTLMTGRLGTRTIERAFSVIGPAIRIEDAVFFILTIVPGLAYSFYRKEERSTSLSSLLANGAGCHGFAAVLWILPFKTQILEWLFWVFVGWGYAMFSALAMKDRLMKRRVLPILSFRQPGALMIATLLYIYHANDPILLIVSTLVLMVAFNSVEFVCRAVRESWTTVSRRAKRTKQYNLTHRDSQFTEAWDNSQNSS